MAVDLDQRPSYQDTLRSAAQKLNVDFSRPTPTGVVITGISQITPLGGTFETWEAMLRGETAGAKMDFRNPHTNIGAPAKFKAEDHFSEKELKFFPNVTAMGKVGAREAAEMSGLLDENGQFDEGKVDRRRVGSWHGSGVAGTPELINAADQIHRSTTKDGTLRTPEQGARAMSALQGIRIFPEEFNYQIANYLRAQGSGGSLVAACDTGAMNVAAAFKEIMSGELDVAVAGGYEDSLSNHGDVAIALFTAARVLSGRNDEPGRAMRPFDLERDGFLMASGGGSLVLESREFALARGANILAEIYAVKNYMDALTPTNLDAASMADGALQAFYDPKTGLYHVINGIFAHATSTKEGDKDEPEAYRMLFGEYLKDIPITAIKSFLGHLLGGAGSVNAVNSVLSVMYDIIPHIANLENIDPEMADLYLIKDKPLRKRVDKLWVRGSGFGSYGTELIVGKPREQLLALAA